MTDAERAVVDAAKLTARAIENFIRARDEEKNGDAHIRDIGTRLRCSARMLFAQSEALRLEAQLIDAVATLSADGGST